jgi:hypothetical protein
MTAGPFALSSTNFSGVPGNCALSRRTAITVPGKSIRPFGLIQEVSIPAGRGLGLPHHKIRVLGVLECHVPTLDLLIETDRKFDCHTLFDRAVRQFRRHRWWCYLA